VLKPANNSVFLLDPRQPCSSELFKEIGRHHQPSRLSRPAKVIRIADEATHLDRPTASTEHDPIQLIPKELLEAPANPASVSGPT